MSGDLSVSRRSWVSISLCLNRLSFTALALPVYLSRWPPLWRATGAECSGQPRGQALTRPASKLRQSLPRLELPQAALLSTGFVCSDKNAASWSKHTHTKRKEGQKDRQKRRKKKKGVGKQTVKCYHRYHLFEKWLSDLETLWLCESVQWDLLNGRCALFCHCYWVGIGFTGIHLLIPCFIHWLQHVVSQNSNLNHRIWGWTERAGMLKNDSINGARKGIATKSQVWQR